MKLKKRYALTGVSFTLPFLAGFALLYLIPFLWSIQKTFTAGAGGIRFAGLQNYADLFRGATLAWRREIPSGLSPWACRC